MHPFEIVGYTYDADFHCAECAANAFTPAELNPENHDAEHEHPHPVYADLESSPFGEICGDCQAVINEPWLPEDVDVKIVEHVNRTGNSDYDPSDNGSWYWLDEEEIHGPYESRESAIRGALIGIDYQW